MFYGTIPTTSTTSFKSDIRSSKKTTIQRGFSIRFLRVVLLLFLDLVGFNLAWSLVSTYENIFVYSETSNVSAQILNSILGISMIAVKELYLPGNHRRDYMNLIQAISVSNFFLVIVIWLESADRNTHYFSYLLSWLFSIAIISGFRFTFDQLTKMIRSQQLMRHSVFLITEPEEKENHIRTVEMDNCYTVQGVTDPSCLDLKNREATFEYLRKEGIEEVFVSWNSIKNRLYICWNFHTSGIILRILSNQIEGCHPKSEFGLLGEVPCLTIPSPVITGIDFWWKRCFDLLCATILVILLSPVYLVIAILIRLDSPGPIFFKQNRVGLHGKEFKIWKFRTMVVDAEKLQAKLEAKNEIKDGVLFKMKEDPRITRLGKFLRLYSLDELPQLFNVLLGQMSLVGPRPLPLRDVERFKTKHFIRQEVLPGITGLWQVSGRSNINSFEDGVKLDISYIENWSFLLDLRILLSTVKVVLLKQGAY